MNSNRRAIDVPALVDGDGTTTGERSSFLLPTGTVTFLLTDVEQSTAGWEAAPEAMAKAISRHYDILAHAVGRHHGEVALVPDQGAGSRAALHAGAVGRRR